MKKYIAAFISLLLITSLLITPALAETPEEVNPPEEAEEVTEGEEEFTEEELEGVLTPDSPWYFIKSFVESIRLTFTFSAEKKTELLGELAEERAKELQALELKYADGEITEKQLATLEKALDALMDLTERYIQRLEDETPEEGGEDQSPQEGDEPAEEDEEPETEDEAEEDDEKYGDKYLRRIAHLKRVAKKAPRGARKGLERAIANAYRQRARMIARGKLQVELPYSLFKLEIASETRKLSVELEQTEDGIKAKVEKGARDRTRELQHASALAYLLPIIEPLELDASLPQEEIIALVLNAFSWEKGYSRLELVVEFTDGNKIEISQGENPGDDTQPQEPEEDPETKPALGYKKFDVKLKANKCHYHLKYDQKKKALMAEVMINQKGKDKVKYKDAEAIEYLESIFKVLKIDASMSRQQIVNGLLQAMGWNKAYDELNVKIEFSDGTKIDFKDKGLALVAGLPYTKFETKIKSGNNKLTVKFEQKRDKVECKVETKAEGKPTKLEKSAALDYLLPILKNLDIKASMPQEEINRKLLAAFAWEGPYDELEIKVTFADKTKINYKSKDKAKPGALPFTKFKLEIESHGKELKVEIEGKKAEVKIEQRGKKEFKLEGKKAVDYLLPIFAKLDINASMSRQEIVKKVLAAFAWEGRYKEFELYAIFPDGSKVKFEVEHDD